MKKSSKPNISPLEVVIENQMASAYLFATVSRGRHINYHLLMMQNLTISTYDKANQQFKIQKTTEQ